MKTPQEARRQICPFKLISGDKSKSMCICDADLCMMWRQGPPPEVEAVLYSTHVWEEPPWDNEKKCYVPPPNRPDNVPPNYKFVWNDTEGETWWVEPNKSVGARRPGYCGLAGRPRD